MKKILILAVGILAVSSTYAVSTQFRLEQIEGFIKNAFNISFDSSSNTADRIYILPDIDGQVALTSSLETTKKSVNQVAHGLAVGDVIRFDGVDYIKAQSNNGDNAEVIGVISSVEGVDDFNYTINGYVSGLSGLTAGDVYFLDDDTAGAVTNDPDNDLDIGDLRKAVYQAISTTEAVVLSRTGFEVNTFSEINTQTGTSYTLALEDNQGIIETDNIGTVTITIPTNISIAFPIGSTITMVQLNTGTTIIQGDTGVTVNGVSAGSKSILGQYEAVSIYKRGVNEWIIPNK